MAEVPKALEARVSELLTTLTSSVQSLPRNTYWTFFGKPEGGEPDRPRPENFASQDAYRDAIREWKETAIGTIEVLRFRREVVAARGNPQAKFSHLCPAAFLTKDGRWERRDDLPWEPLVEEQRRLLRVQMREDLERNAAREIAETIDRAFEAFGFRMDLPPPLTTCTEVGPITRTIQSCSVAPGPNIGVRHFLEHGRLFNRWTDFGGTFDRSNPKIAIRYEFEANAGDFVLHIDTDLRDQDLMHMDDVQRWEFEQLLETLKASFDSKPFTAIQKLDNGIRSKASG